MKTQSFFYWQFALFYFDLSVGYIVSIYVHDRILVNICQYIIMLQADALAINRIIDTFIIGF